MGADRSPRVVAIEAAIAELERLKEHHGPLLLFQSGGCCDGSSPMCVPEGELRAAARHAPARGDTRTHVSRGGAVRRSSGPGSGGRG